MKSNKSPVELKDNLPDSLKRLFLTGCAITGNLAANKMNVDQLITESVYLGCETFTEFQQYEAELARTAKVQKVKALRL